MKIILHMGLRKTGTTSLQSALWASRDKLRAHGAVYPDGGAGRENHKLLTVLIHDPDLVTRDVKLLFNQDEERASRAALKMWAAMKKEIDRTRPELLILSSEYLVAHPRAEAYHKLRDLLSQLSNEIVPVLYFREAAAHFGSDVQQSIKNGRPFDGFDGSRLQRETPLIEAAFGRSIVACVADRDQLIDGDIVTDFLTRFVVPVVGEVTIVPVRLNESISPEALAILDRFRRLRYPNHLRPMPEHHSLRRILTRLDGDFGRPASPRLRPEVAAAVGRSSLDTLWLRDRYGVAFKGVDYTAIDGAPVDFDPQRTTIEDLFEVDLERRDALQAAALEAALRSWRRLDRMPRLSRFLEAAGGKVFSRRGRGAPS